VGVPGDASEARLVVDVTEDGLGAKVTEEPELLRRPRQRDDVVALEVEERFAAEDAARAGEENARQTSSSSPS
jgi:hypothetical protein